MFKITYSLFKWPLMCGSLQLHTSEDVNVQQNVTPGVTALPPKSFPFLLTFPPTHYMSMHLAFFLKEQHAPRLPCFLSQRIIFPGPPHPHILPNCFTPSFSHPSVPLGACPSTLHSNSSYRGTSNHAAHYSPWYASDWLS